MSQKRHSRGSLPPPPLGTHPQSTSRALVAHSFRAHPIFTARGNEKFEFLEETRIKGIDGNHRESSGIKGNQRKTPGIAGNHQESPGITGNQRESEESTGVTGINGNHQESRESVLSGIMCTLKMGVIAPSVASLILVFDLSTILIDSNGIEVKDIFRANIRK